MADLERLHFQLPPTRNLREADIVKRGVGGGGVGRCVCLLQTWERAVESGREERKAGVVMVMVRVGGGGSG